MEVKVAKTAGFCFGVQRAVDKVYELIDSCPDRLFTLGPIIHNEEVVNDLEKKGVRVASGVYLVLSATEDSKESVVTKIAVIK